MTPAFALILVCGFGLLLALGAWVAGPDDAHQDARRRNPPPRLRYADDLPDPWWRG